MSEDLKICCGCTLSGEIHVGLQSNLCELCDCSEPFTVEAVNKAFQNCFKVIYQLREELETVRSEREDWDSVIIDLRGQVREREYEVYQLENEISNLREDNNDLRAEIQDM